MNKANKSTIYDIAKQAKISPSTVSSILNGTWKKRRIRPDTANKVLHISRQLGYSINRQARGLRKAQSGLVGLILPDYNSFFARLAQEFSIKVRSRDLCPVIVSTDRNPDEEISTIEDFASYAIDSLFIAGATAPEAISQFCRKAEIKHIFIDQPCELAASVMTDNRSGAYDLTSEIFRTMKPVEDPLRNRPYFLGGDNTLSVTLDRKAGFIDKVESELGFCHPDQIILCSYDTDMAETEVKKLYDRLGGLPSGLFVNSISSFEGVLRFLITIPEHEIRQCSLGCFDFDPFGLFFRIPVHMIRQKPKELINEAFKLLDEEALPGTLIEIPPQLFPA